MKTTIQRLAQGATRLLVLALGIGLAATGWAAVKPAVVWNGDISSDTLTRNGFTLVPNDNTVAGGKITLVSTAKGVTLAPSSGGFDKTQGRFTAVVGYSNIVASAKSGALWTLYTSRDGDTTGVSLNDYGFIGVNLGNANYSLTTSGGNYPSDGGLYYVGAYFSTDKIDGYQSLGGKGTYTWVKSGDSTISAGKDGLVYSQETSYYGMTFGGFKDESGHQLTNAVISYIVFFTNQQEVAATTVSTWALSNMKTVGTDLGTATAETGVNLPASATLSAAVTPAAVFVQQTSTLTVTGAGSLNINNGNGPLYVADGTTLTIDATGVTSLAAQNPSVSLVSAKIYGTDLITVKVPVVSGGRATASVTEDGITLTYSGDTVSITSPFDGSTLAEPTSATGYGTSATSMSFGNNEAFLQMIEGRTAIVADVFGGTFTDVNGFLKMGETTSNTNKDVYLVVSGATARRINGVQEAHWSVNTRRTRTEGDAIVQIEDGATVDYVYGAGYKGGRMPTTVDGTDDSGASAQVQGNTGVTVKGGTVNGSIIGGWSSAHNGTPTVTGNTAVRIEKVLDTATATAEDGNVVGGYVVGGSVYQANSASGSLVGGNSSVTLALAGKSGTFNRTVIGGSAQFAGTTSGNHNVTGDSSVTITAANDVTFPNQIVGGGAKLVSSGSGVVNVDGNSSVTIFGGTYTGRIVAGGYAPNGGTANVSGTATLTLNSGVFTGATLDGGNATGEKTLVVGNNLDISGATATGFTAVTLGDGATARMTVGEEGPVTLGDGATLILDVTDEAVAYGHTATVVSKGAGASIKYYENGVEITDSSRLDGDNLNASAPVWSPAEADASGNFADVSRWSTGTLPADNTSVVKLVVNGNNTLTINETRTFGHLYVEGSGTLSIQGDNTHYLYANDVTIASGVTIKIVGISGAFQPKNGTISGGTAIVIPALGFLQLDGVACSTKIDLQSDGHLWTKGTTSLSSTANTFASGSQLVTKTGTNESPSTTTVYSAGTSFNSTVTVEESSTLIAEHTSDMVDWTKSTRINVYGKLTVNCRWSMNPSNEIYFYPGAVIDGTGDGTAIFDMLNANSVIHVAAKPGSGATGTVTCSAPIRLRANATVDVAEGMTFTMTGESKKQNTAMGYTKTGLGVFNINGTYSAGGTTTVSAGEVVQTVAMQGPVSIGDNGTYTLKNQAMTQVISGTGKLVLLKDTNANLVHTANSTFSGELTITRNNNSNHHVFGGDVEDTSSAAKFLTGSPSLEIGGTNPYLCLNRQVAGNWLAVKNLTASSADLIVDAVYGGANHNTYVIKTIKTLQTKDTTFAGKFNGASKTGRRVDLYVYGENETVHSLELTGDNTKAYGTLTVENYGKVKFSGSGNWAQGNVVVGQNGYLESSNAGAVKDLTLSDGANIVFPTASSSLTGITSLTFASGTTYISFADGVTPTVGTLIDWSGASLESAPAGDFQLVGSVAGDWILTKSASGLSIAAAAAKVTPTTGKPVPYASVDAARNAFATLIGTDEGATLTILDGTTLSEQDMSQLAQDNIYYDSSSGVLTKAVAKVGQTCYPSLSAAISDGAAVTLLRNSSEAITLNVAITLTETAAYSGTLSGSGTLTLSALRSSALSLGEWTGTVVLPQVNGTADGFRFDYYGKSGSTIAIAEGFYGWINTSTADAYQIKAGIWIDNDSQVTINGTNSGTWYQIAKLSGTGNFSLIQSNAPAGFHILVLEDYSGTLSNTIGSGTPAALTVSRLNLAAAPVAGQKLINTTTPNAVNLETVYVGDAQQSVSLAKGVDGIYVACATYAGTGYISVAAAIDAVVAAGGDVSAIMILDGSTALPAGYEQYYIANNTVNTYKTVTVTGEHMTATVAPNSEIKSGDVVTITVAPAVGYVVDSVTTSSGTLTNNGNVYSLTVDGDATITVTAVEVQQATISDVTFNYMADYQSAKTVTATVSAPGTYTLTVGGNSYNATAETANSTITFNDVTGLSLGANVDYTITAGGAASGAYNGQTTVGNVTDGWIVEPTSGTATGSWFESDGTTAATVTYTEGKALVQDKIYKATTESIGEIVTITTRACFGDAADSGLTVSSDAQAAVRIGETSTQGVYTFEVLTDAVNQTWLPVAADGLVVSPSTEYAVTVALNYTSRKYSVSVAAGESSWALANGETSLFNMAASGTNGARSIQFMGSGTLASIVGSYVGSAYVETVEGESIVVNQQFVNEYLGTLTAAEAQAKLSPSSNEKAANGCNNYFECYALGLDPTEEDDKLVVDVSTDANGNFVFTVKHPTFDGEGNIIGYEAINAADNVQATVTYKYGTTVDGNKTAITGDTISPSAMFDGQGGNVLYYKAEVSIGAK